MLDHHAPDRFRPRWLRVAGVEGIEKYLASGQMRGIGPAMAKRIVAAFGEGTFDIIEASPQRARMLSTLARLTDRAKPETAAGTRPPDENNVL